MILIVKSPFALVACLALLTACGQTGPLTMPKPPARPAATPATPAPVQTVTPPAPAAGVTPPVVGSSANTDTTHSAAPANQR